MPKTKAAHGNRAHSTSTRKDLPRTPPKEHIPNTTDILPFRSDPQNVHEYFRAALNAAWPADRNGTNRDLGAEIAECPLVSVCGVECREAIDAGRILLKKLIDSFGDPGDPKSHPESLRHTEAVIYAVAAICECIYFG